MNNKTTFKPTAMINYQAFFLNKFKVNNDKYLWYLIAFYVKLKQDFSEET